MYDVLIIGAGVTGCAIARELSRRQLDIAVLEKEEDIGAGTSKANSAIIHAGYDAQPGSLKARMNVLGNQMMDSLASELDFPFTRNGSLVLCFDEAGIPRLEELRLRGEQNGVPGLRIVSGPERKEIEPGISDEVKAFLYAPTGGIVCPFAMTLALAENAADNGVQFYRNTKVTGIRRMDSSGFQVTAIDENGNGTVYSTRTIVNASGVYADEIHRMLSRTPMHITPRRGEYCLLDKTAASLTSHTLFQLPGPLGKGILVTPTVHGNILIGPTAEDIDDKEAIATTAEGLHSVLEKGARSLSAPIPAGQIITSFAGLRACEDCGDFRLGAEDVPGLFSAAGIASPGLTAAPAIGRYLADIVSEYLHAEPKANVIARRTDIPHIAGSSPEEIARLIAEDPAFGHVICRCETVTEGEILASIRRPLGARSLDGVKRRTRAGMGRCQSGFCAPKVMELLERELSLSPFAVTKHGPGSELLTGRIQGREAEAHERN